MLLSSCFIHQSKPKSPNTKKPKETLPTPTDQQLKLWLVFPQPSCFLDTPPLSTSWEISLLLLLLLFLFLFIHLHRLEFISTAKKYQHTNTYISTADGRSKDSSVHFSSPSSYSSDAPFSPPSLVFLKKNTVKKKQSERKRERESEKMSFFSFFFFFLRRGRVRTTM